MEDKKILLDNIDKIHTTEMGIDRIKRNLKIDTADVVEYCKNKMLDKNCNIYNYLLDIQKNLCYNEPQVKKIQ